VAARSKVWVWGRSLDGMVGSNLTGGIDVCLVRVVFSPAEVSASGSSLVQRSPTKCGVPECDREAAVMRTPWPIRDRCAMGKNYYYMFRPNCTAIIRFLQIHHTVFI
jgi:hypothetical protein